MNPIDKADLWRLFFHTGLPEVYLALCSVQREKNEYPIAQTAFRVKPARDTEL